MELIELDATAQRALELLTNAGMSDGSIRLSCWSISNSAHIVVYIAIGNQNDKEKEMLYTTYFAKLRTLPPDITPVSICGKTPEWYTGAQYKKLAPKWDFFQEWKKTRDNHFYVRSFDEQVLSKLNAKQVYDELTAMTLSADIALVCYEKPESFCHRHLVANWFRENGFAIKEWGS